MFLIAICPRHSLRVTQLRKPCRVDNEGSVEVIVYLEHCVLGAAAISCMQKGTHACACSRASVPITAMSCKTQLCARGRREVTPARSSAASFSAGVLRCEGFDHAEVFRTRQGGLLFFATELLRVSEC